MGTAGGSRCGGFWGSFAYLLNPGSPGVAVSATVLFSQVCPGSLPVRSEELKCWSIRMTPHPVIVIIMDNKDCIRVLLFSYCTTITGLGVLLNYQI